VPQAHPRAGPVVRDFLARSARHASASDVCTRSSRSTASPRCAASRWSGSTTPSAHARGIRALPAAKLTNETFHDPLPPLLPKGIPVRATVESIRPRRRSCSTCATTSIACHGLNLSEACAINNSVAGVFNCLPSDIPRNAGSFRRIEMRLREGRRGIRVPDQLFRRDDESLRWLVNTVQSAFAQLGTATPGQGGVGMVRRSA